jgi:isocitrate/isopropylmalate dehydrogenase
LNADCALDSGHHGSGGIYFGQPRGIEKLENGGRRGFNTQSYTDAEIRRVARVAFDLARQRRRRLCSVEKSNVMESGLLWRQEVEALGAPMNPSTGRRRTLPVGASPIRARRFWA